MEGAGRMSPDAGGDEHATARLIARVAAQLFAERGVDATSVRAIAEGAGVTCPTLYYHFRNKEGLAKELVNRPLAGLTRTFRALAEDATTDPVCRLARMVDAYLGFSRDEPDAARLVHAILFGPADRALACETDAHLGVLGSILVDAAERVAEAGIIPRDRAACLALAIRGQVMIQSINFLYRGGDLGPELAGRLVRDALIGFAEPDARQALLSRCFTREATRPGAGPAGQAPAGRPGGPVR